MALDVDLGKMVGPLPLGAWLAVVGGGIGIMAYTRKQATDDYVVSEPDTTGIPDDEQAVGTGGWTYTPPGSVSGDDSIETDPETNDSWARRAIQALIAMGYNAAVSDAAIRKYMEGERLSASEYALVTQALTVMGPPPIILPAPLFGPPTAPKLPGTPTAPTKGKPTTVPKPKPVSKPHIRYYTVRPGDTLSRIGKKYRVSWQAIYNANRKGKRRADGKPGMISNPNNIRVGWRLVIPNS